MGSPLSAVNKKKRGQYHHGDLRSALLHAAVDLVAESGATQFTLREAAKRAGVSPAAPYRHFEDRTALLAAVAEEGFGILLPEMRAALEAHPDDSLAALAALGVSFVQFGVRHPAYFQLMYGPHLPDRSGHPDLVDLDLQGFQMLTEAIGLAQAEGRLRQGDVRQMALVALSFVYGAVSVYLDGEMRRLGFSHDEARATLGTAGLYMLRGLAED